MSGSNPYRPDTPSEEQVALWRKEADERGLDPDNYIDNKINKAYTDKLVGLLPEEEDDERIARNRGA